MPPVLAVLACFAFYFVGYAFYSRYLATKIFALRADHPTPAHTMEDGIDYVPTHKLVVGGIISFIAVWLVVEAILALWRYSRSEPVESLEVVLPE